MRDVRIILEGEERSQDFKDQTQTHTAKLRLSGCQASYISLKLAGRLLCIELIIVRSHSVTLLLCYYFLPATLTFSGGEKSDDN